MVPQDNCIPNVTNDSPQLTFFDNTMPRYAVVKYGSLPLPMWQTRNMMPHVFKRGGSYVCAVGGFTPDDEPNVYYGIEAVHDTPLRAYCQLMIYLDHMTAEEAIQLIKEKE